MKDRIQSLASLLFGAAVVLLVGWLTFEQLGHPARARAETDAGPSMAAAEAAPPPGPAASGSASPASVIAPSTFSERSRLPVPRAWACSAPNFASSKPDAFKHAQELAEQARGDFKAAVKAGDSGSSEDIGRIPRGVLEKSTELAVFSLAAGDVSEPLETLRGYWVVKRLE